MLLLLLLLSLPVGAAFYPWGNFGTKDRRLGTRPSASRLGGGGGPVFRRFLLSVGLSGCCVPLRRLWCTCVCVCVCMVCAW